MAEYGIVYKTTFPNGKIYIGQTTRKNNEYYFGSGVNCWRAIKKYGSRNLKRETLRVCKNKKELDNWEKIYIKVNNSMNINVGYNIDKGGKGLTPEIKEYIRKFNLGKVWSNEIKEKISKSVSKSMTKERRLEISKQHKGKVISKKSRKLLSIATKGSNNPMYGKRGKDSLMFGRKWVTNGIECKFIDVSKGLPQGYRLGRIFNKK